MNNEVLIEVCCGDAASIEAARRAGAARMELCSALEAGGVTPTPPVIRRAVDSGVAVNVLLRPRSGDFLYSAAEADIIDDEIRMARDCGAAGVVVGALRPDGTPDMALVERWAATAAGMSVTFHRAFDLCADPFGAVDMLAPVVDRILTSGLAPDALTGAPMLRRLVDHAAGRLIILAGGGVTASNVRRLVDLTGIAEVHGTFSAPLSTAMTFRREGVSMGTPGTDEYSRKSTSLDLLRQAIHNLKQ